MFRGAVRVSALLSMLMLCESARAHDGVPVAFGVLSHDAEGARAVQLSHGLALRRAAQRFQFVCPAAWGDMYPAPLAALADGTMVVGGSRGLVLLAVDGKARVHPDAVAQGATLELARSALGVFSLRTTPAGGSEVLAIDAQHARVLWKDPSYFTSLAAFDDKIVVLREQNLTLEQVTLAAADGRELSRQRALLQSPVDYVFARAMEGAAYALIMFRSSTVLGRLDMNMFTKLAQGELAVAGPLHTGDTTLVAPDGKLSQLVGAEPTPLAADNVLCLAQDDGLAYACQPDGIARVSGQTLGDPLFQFGWLMAPDLTLASSDVLSADCNAQWQDLRIDLLMAGMPLPDGEFVDAGAPNDAGPMADAASSADAANDSDATMPGNVDGPDAGDAGLIPATPSNAKDAGGCTLSSRSQNCNLLACLYMALLLLVRRRAISRRLTARAHAVGRR